MVRLFFFLFHTIVIKLSFLLLFLLKISRFTKKIFLGKGLKNPLLKFYFERDYQIRHKAFLLKGADKSVKKRRDPKTGTIGEVRPLNTSQKWGQIF